jgi:hypothetical protein
MLDMSNYVNDITYLPRPDKDEGSAAYSEWRNHRERFEAREKELIAQFLSDALDDLGIADHPRAYEAFDIAFQECWITSGLSGVYNLLSQIAELLR